MWSFLWYYITVKDGNGNALCVQIRAEKYLQIHNDKNA